MHDSPRSATLKNDWPNYSQGYKILNAIGKGYFGIVWKGEVLEGRHKGKEVAVKKLDLEKCGNTKIEEIRKNVLLLNLLDHPNILSYKTSFICSKDLWVVTELMEGGSVDKIIQQKSPSGFKDQALIATIIKETLQGLKYLHQNNQIHRDIKAGNILIGSDGSVKISDFGVSAKLKEGKKRCTFIGSPCWMAPEVLENLKDGYDSKVDIWSLGITALELAHGKPPNCELTTMKLILKTLNEEPPVLNKEECFDDHFREFLSYCLIKDPSKRKSADDLLKCCKSFFNKAKGKEYIKEKLIKGLGTLESRVDIQTLELAISEYSSEKKNCKGNTLDFCFTVADKEQDEEKGQLNQQVMPQVVVRSHLTRVDTGVFLKRTLSNPENNERIKEPKSAASKIGGNYFQEKENIEEKKSKFAQKQKSERILICKGDLTNDFNLPEEEA